VKGKFIRFQLEIPERKEDYLTEDLVQRLNADYEQKRGIYLFGDVEIAATKEKETLVICGSYEAPTTAECKARLKILKEEIRRTFTVKKITNLVVGWETKSINHRGEDT